MRLRRFALVELQPMSADESSSDESRNKTKVSILGTDPGPTRFKASKVYKGPNGETYQGNQPPPEYILLY